MKCPGNIMSGLCFTVDAKFLFSALHLSHIAKDETSSVDTSTQLVEVILLHWNTAEVPYPGVRESTLGVST